MNIKNFTLHIGDMYNSWKSFFKFFLKNDANPFTVGTLDYFTVRNLESNDFPFLQLESGGNIDQSDLALILPINKKTSLVLT